MIVNDKLAHHFRVINYAPRVINYAPREISYAPRVINYAPRVINYALRVIKGTFIVQASLMTVVI